MHQRITLILATPLLVLLALAPHGYVPRATAAEQPCFPETKQCINDAFRSFWEQNGSLPVFGFPTAAAANELNRDTGQTYLTQWFERNRLELHPEKAALYAILLGRLGDERLRQLGRDWQTFPKASTEAAHYFTETGHAVAPQFWNYWRGHGLELGDAGISERESLALFGLPLSEPAMETNESGHTVLTQWFERARFEYHPENPAPYKVLLGLLGNEIRAGNTPRTLTAQAIGNSSVGGDYLVWAEGNGAASPTVTRFHVYNLVTREQFAIPSNGADRGAPVTDGTTIVWSEFEPGPNQRIMGYDLASRTTRTILESQGSTRFGDYALAEGVLYYTDDTHPHFGIFARTLTTGHERRLSDQIGGRLVARDGVLLWRTYQSCGRACPMTETLHLLRLSDGSRRELTSGTLQLSGYDVSGDVVVWARYGEPVQIYRINQGTTTPLQQSGTGVVFNPIIRGDHVVWGAGPSAGQEKPQWSIMDYKLSTNAPKTVTTVESGQVQPAGLRGTVLVYSEATPAGTWQLRIINLE